MKAQQTEFHSRKYFTLTIYIFLIIAGVFFSSCSHNTIQPKLISLKPNFEMSVAHFNDSHANIDPIETKFSILNNDKTSFEVYAQLGGYSRLKYKLIELRDLSIKNKQNFIVLNGGDAFQGSLYFTKFQGEEEARLFSEMKIDGMVLGNHEFDLGNNAIRKFANLVNFPILAANLIKSSSKTLADVKNIQTYEIKEFNGEKVGIFGILIESMASISSPDSDTQFLPEIETAKKTVETLKNLGINKIIMITHLGLLRDKTIAESVNGIDLIVGGHSHTLLGDFSSLNLDSNFTNQTKNEDNTYAQMIQNPDGGKTCIVQSGEKALAYGLAHLAFDKDGALVFCAGKNTILSGDQFTHEYTPKVKATLTAKDQDHVLKYIKKSTNIEVVPEDKEMNRIINTELKPAVKDLESQIIARIPEKLLHKRIPNAVPATLDPLVAESFYWKLNSLNMKVDFTIQNSGSIRTDINPGALTLGHVVGTVLPFGNKIVAFNIKGKDFKDTLEYIINSATGNEENLISTGAFPYVGHLRYTYNGRAKKGSRITQLQQLVEDTQHRTKKMNWVNIRDEKIYRIATNDYAAKGKDGYIGLLKRNDLPEQGAFVNSGLSDNEVFVEYIKNQKNLKPIPYRTVIYISHK
jgi:5'-nucleotidase